MNSPARVSPRLRPRRGFALLVTIVLVAFLVLILVGLATFTRVETQVASNSQQLAAARQNALMALNIALGQLQQSAGPDQRVTAPAAILDSTPATVAIDGVAQPHWTAVWPTGAAGLDVVNSGTPQRQTSLGSTTPSIAQKTAAATWLVSNPNPAVALNPTTYAGVTSGATPDAVILARQIGATPNDVTVPLVPITIPAGQLPGFTATDTTATAIGRYAYWVSDEGVKAKVNLTDPTLASADSTINQLHHWVPQANAMHKLLPMAASGTDFRTTPVAEIERSFTPNSLRFVSTIATTYSPATYEPDVTTYSRGVLADVRNGGLKKDLTAAFENSATFDAFANTYGKGLTFLYRSGVDSVPIVSTGGGYDVPDGPLWYSLFFHYNSYKRTIPTPLAVTGGALTSSGVGDASNSLPHGLSIRVNTVVPSGAAAAIKLGGLTPVLLAYRLDVAVSSYNNAGTWLLRVHYYPQLVLYNPYSVRLSLANYQFQRNFNAFSSNTLSGTVGAAAIAAFNVNQAPGGRLNLVTRAGDCDSLEPGETRVFALTADTSKADLPTAITFSDLRSDPGMSADYSQYADLPGFGGTANGADAVNLSLNSRNLNMNAVDTFVQPRGAKWPNTDGSNRYLNGAPPATSAAVGTLSVSRIDAMTTPRRIIGAYIRVKGLQNIASTYTYTNGANIMPLLHGNTGTMSVFEDATSAQWQEVYLSPLGSLYQNSQTDVNIVPSSGGLRWQTSWGDASAGVAAGATRYVLRDVPTQPLVSLGQFMHMPVYAFNTVGNFQTYSPGTMAVGGSYCSPIVPTNQTATQTIIGTSQRVFMDDSFLANEALFDRFFLSTVPPAGSAPAGTTWPAYWSDFNTANSGATLTDTTKPLLNNRLKPYAAEGQTITLADLRDVNRAAANLLLDGAFNVNSTSVAAWKAYLGGVSGNQLRIYNAAAGSTANLNLGTGTNATPFARFWSASNTASPNQPWDGLRVLDDTELNELATRIVEQVKLRGPFLSMADFLNRRLGPAGALTRTGALQAAIDNASPALNSAALSRGLPVSAAGGAPAFIPANLSDGAGNALNSAVGMPGYLMQQDIVQACSAAMTVRSDSFVVRTYGESVNPVTGVSQGKAWAEAVLQRLPEFVDPSLAPETDLATAPASAATTINQTFGRRFKVVGFRWLSPNDL